MIHLMPFKTCVMGCLFNGSWGAIRAWIRWPRLYLQKLSKMILKVSRQELMWTKFAPAICFTHHLKSHFKFVKTDSFQNTYIYVPRGTCVISWLLLSAFDYFRQKGSKLRVRVDGTRSNWSHKSSKTLGYVKDRVPPTNQSVERC